MLVEGLRVGNLLGLPDGSMITLTRETLAGILAGDKSSEPLRALRATPSSLLLLGFEAIDGTFYVNRDYPAIKLKNAGEEMTLYWGDAEVLRAVIDLHRLQNIIYDIYGSQPQYIPPRDELAEAIQAAADSVLHKYLPSDRLAGEIVFALAIEGESYNVTYKKDHQGYWTFHSYEPVLS